MLVTKEFTLKSGEKLVIAAATFEQTLRAADNLRRKSGRTKGDGDFADSLKLIRELRLLQLHQLFFPDGREANHAEKEKFLLEGHRTMEFVGEKSDEIAEEHRIEAAEDQGNS